MFSECKAKCLMVRKGFSMARIGMKTQKMSRGYWAKRVSGHSPSRGGCIYKGTVSDSSFPHTWP